MSDSDIQEDPFADPSIQEGEEMIYCKEIKFRVQFEGEKPTKRPIIFKMIEKKDEDGELERIRFEISEQADIFFLYEVEYDQESYEELRSKEELKTTFEEFPPIMEEIIEAVAAEKNEYYTVFRINKNESYNLDIVMPLKFKDVKIFSLEFHKSDEDLIRDQVQYRYNIVQLELRKTKIATANILDFLKHQDPTRNKDAKSVKSEKKSRK